MIGEGKEWEGVAFGDIDSFSWFMRSLILSADFVIDIDRSGPEPLFLNKPRSLDTLEIAGKHSL